MAETPLALPWFETETWLMVRSYLLASFYLLIHITCDLSQRHAGASQRTSTALGGVRVITLISRHQNQAPAPTNPLPPGEINDYRRFRTVVWGISLANSKSLIKSLAYNSATFIQWHGP